MTTENHLPWENSENKPKVELETKNSEQWPRPQGCKLLKLWVDTNYFACTRGELLVNIIRQI